MQNSIILLAFMIFSFAMILTFKNNQKNLYFSYCSDYKHNVFSCPKNQNIRFKKSTLKVLIKEQLVIFKDFDRELNSCEVFDVNNWKCSDVVMQDGKYFEGFNTSFDEKDEIVYFPVFNQISASSYYIKSIINFFKIYS